MDEMDLQDEFLMFSYETTGFSVEIIQNEDLNFSFLLRPRKGFSYFGSERDCVCDSIGVPI